MKKNNNFMQLVMTILLLVITSYVNAGKIRYARNVAYKGEVVDKKPIGQGELTVDCISNVVETTVGTFTENKVRGKLTIKEKYDNSTPYMTFEGTIEYEIQNGRDGSAGIEYTMYDGILNLKRCGSPMKIEAVKPFKLTSYPGKGNYSAIDGFYVKANYYNLNGLRDSELECYARNIGEVKDVYYRYSFLDSYFKIWAEPTKTDYTHIEYKDLVANKVNGSISIEYNNGDYFMNLGSSNIKFLRHFSDGEIVRWEGDITKFGNEFIPFIDKGGNFCVIEINTGFNLYETIMRKSSLPKNLKIYRGELAKTIIDAYGGMASARYKLGLAYINGDGIIENVYLGEQWIKKAADASYSDAVAYINKKEEKERIEREAKKKEEDAKTQKNYNWLCQKFGKKYVDAALKKTPIIGMPEELFVLSFRNNLELVEEGSNYRLYRVRGFGVIEGVSKTTITDSALLHSVWVRNGKISSIRNW